MIDNILKTEILFLKKTRHGYQIKLSPKWTFASVLFLNLNMM